MFFLIKCVVVNVCAFSDIVVGLSLARGRLIAEGKPDIIRDHPKVQEVYFGSGKTFEKTQDSGKTPEEQAA